MINPELADPIIILAVLSRHVFNQIKVAKIDGREMFTWHFETEM